jgi:hypothetical protein
MSLVCNAFLTPRKVAPSVILFDEEIKLMPAMFVKANKNFACYAIVGVL